MPPFLFSNSELSGRVCDLIKVGGCVLTNKNGRYEINVKNVETIARKLKDICDQCLERPLIMVLGGGSFGNLAPKEFNVENSRGSWRNIDLTMVPVAAFDLFTKAIRIFHDVGVPVFPFQTGAVIHCSNGVPILNSAPVMNAIECGCIPLFCGDLVFDDQNVFQIFSSDNIAVAIAHKIKLGKVLYYTNVDGLYYPNMDGEVVKCVNKDNFESALKAAGPSAENDLTGGMSNKLIQLIKLAEFGVGSQILNYSYFDRLEVSLKEDINFGTLVKSFLV